MKYSDVRAKISSGDLLAWSHNEIRLPTLIHDLQVKAVRLAGLTEFTHVGLALPFGGRVWLLESVEPLVRMVPLSNVIGDGFYWLPLNKAMSDAELEWALSKVATAEYSKWEGIRAQLGISPASEDMECAKYAAMSRILSGVDIGNRYTPSAVVKRAQVLGFAQYWVEP
jgi:hypothetical protein